MSCCLLADLRAAALNIRQGVWQACSACSCNSQVDGAEDMEEVWSSSSGSTVDDVSRSSSISAVVDEAIETAQARVGRLTVEGRYHRLPRRLEDDYDLAGRKTLGTGCSGAVFLARSRRTGAAHAVKSFDLVDMSATDREFFVREVGVYLSMDHPHVARLMAIYESETEISMVMECCEGGELFDRLGKKKFFAEEEAAQATWQMLLAINYLHGEGVAHRDLKLENFMYEQKGRDFLKLIDFGFSKFFHESTAMNESLGTIQYIAPEVLDKRYFGGSCDMWSLGVIVFVLLSGRLPFYRDSNHGTIRAIRRGSFKMQFGQWSRISETAKDFVRRLLVVEPRDRMTAQQAMEHPWLAKYRSTDAMAPGRCLAGAAASPAVSDIPEAFLSFARAPRFQQACMQLMAWTLPLEERRLLRDTFLEMDIAYTGVLRFPQIDRLLEESYRMSEADRAAVCKALAALDFDQDGELHYSDFLAVMMAPRLKQGAGCAVEEAFRRLDIDGLGHITEEGLRQTLGEEVSGLELQRTFRLLDVDKDHKIYLKDFVAYLHGTLDASATSLEPGSETDNRSALLYARRLPLGGA